MGSSVGTGRAASKTASPRRAWERETTDIPKEPSASIDENDVGAALTPHITGGRRLAFAHQKVTVYLPQDWGPGGRRVNGYLKGVKVERKESSLYFHGYYQWYSIVSFLIIKDTDWLVQLRSYYRPASGIPTNRSILTDCALPRQTINGQTAYALFFLSS